MTKYAQMLFILLGTGLMAAGFFLADLIPPTWISILIGILWLVAAWFKWTWLVNLSFLGLFFISGGGIWFGLPPFLVACSMVAGLMAWDLHYFSMRLQSAGMEDNINRLEGNHLIRLLLLGFVSAGICFLAMNLRFQFTFGWTLVFVILVIGGIALLANMIRNMT